MTRYGKTASLDVTKIAKTFSSKQEEFYFDKILKNKKTAYNYLMNIEPQTWRSMSWLTADPLLPPRYGIVTSNTSKSINNMLDKYRNVSWLYLLEGVIDFWGTRNSNKQEKYKAVSTLRKLSPRLNEFWKLDGRRWLA